MQTWTSVYSTPTRGPYYMGGSLRGVTGYRPWYNSVSASGTSAGSGETTTGAQEAWYCNESASPLSGSVNNILLTATGTITYEVAAAGSPGAAYTPGVTIASGTTHGFYNATAQPSMSIGTNDLSAFWVANQNAFASGHLPQVFTQQPTITVGYEIHWYNDSFPRVWFSMYASEYVYNEAAWNNATTNGIPGDGLYHEFRLDVDRDASAACACVLYIDGVSQGGQTMSTIVGSSITNAGAWLGYNGNTTRHSFNGTILFYRQKASL